MNRLLLVLLALCLTFAANAQNNDGGESQQGNRERRQREQITPEKATSNEIEQMKKVLSLTETQYKALYEACLKSRKEILALRQNRTPQMGGGMDGAQIGDGGMSRQDVMNQIRAQREAIEKSLNKKYKKIMGDEAFAKWETFVKEERTKREAERATRRSNSSNQ